MVRSVPGLTIYHINGLLMVTFPSMNIWYLSFINVAASLTGFIALIPMSCYAYLADVISDPKELTSRMIFMSVAVRFSSR